MLPQFSIYEDNQILNASGLAPSTPIREKKMLMTIPYFVICLINDFVPGLTTSENIFARFLQ